MAVGGDQQQQGSSFVSMSDLLEQIQTNKEHLERLETPKKKLFKRLGSCDSVRSSSGSDHEAVPEPKVFATSPSTQLVTHLGTHLGTQLIPVRELDVDADTFLCLCFPCPMITLQALRRKIHAWFRNLLWPRPPLPCVGTTCGPVHHVRTCEFHCLAGGLPYKDPIRRCISLPSLRVRRTNSLPALCSSSNSPSSASASSE